VSCRYAGHVNEDVKATVLHYTFVEGHEDLVTFWCHETALLGGGGFSGEMHYGCSAVKESTLAISCAFHADHWPGPPPLDDFFTSACSTQA